MSLLVPTRPYSSLLVPARPYSSLLVPRRPSSSLFVATSSLPSVTAHQANPSHPASPTRKLITGSNKITKFLSPRDNPSKPAEPVEYFSVLADILADYEELDNSPVTPCPTLEFPCATVVARSKESPLVELSQVAHNSPSSSPDLPAIALEIETFGPFPLSDSTTFRSSRMTIATPSGEPLRDLWSLPPLLPSVEQSPFTVPLTLFVFQVPPSVALTSPLHSPDDTSRNTRSARRYPPLIALAVPEPSSEVPSRVTKIEEEVATPCRAKVSQIQSDPLRVEERFSDGIEDAPSSSMVIAYSSSVFGTYRCRDWAVTTVTPEFRQNSTPGCSRYSSQALSLASPPDLSSDVVNSPDLPPDIPTPPVVMPAHPSSPEVFVQSAPLAPGSSMFLTSCETIPIVQNPALESHRESCPSPPLCDAAFWVLLVCWFISLFDNETSAPLLSMLPPSLRSHRLASRIDETLSLSRAICQFHSSSRSPSPDSLVAIFEPYRRPRIHNQSDFAELSRAHYLCCDNLDTPSHPDTTRFSADPCSLPAIAPNPVRDHHFSLALVVVAFQQLLRPRWTSTRSHRLPCFQRSPVTGDKYRFTDQVNVD